MRIRTYLALIVLMVCGLTVRAATPAYRTTDYAIFPTNLLASNLIGSASVVIASDGVGRLTFTSTGGNATNAQPPSANLTNWSTLSTNVLDIYINRNAGVGTNNAFFVPPGDPNAGSYIQLRGTNVFFSDGAQIWNEPGQVFLNVVAQGGLNLISGTPLNVATNANFALVRVTNNVIVGGSITAGGNISSTNVTITNRVISGLQTLSYSGTNVTVNWALGNHFSLLVTNSFKIWFTNGPGANWSQTGLIDVRQDGTGGHLMYWDSTNIETNSTGLVLSTAANSKDKLYVATDHTGTNFQVLLNKGFLK